MSVERIKAFQSYLTDKYLEFLRTTGQRKASDSDFAKWLGVTPPSLNQWINGHRTPNFENAVRMSQRLGPEIFEVLGYPHIVATNDDQLRYLIDHWAALDDDTKRVIFDHVKEEVTGHEQKREKQREEQRVNS